MSALPEGQHRWEDTFHRDELGRPLPPKFHRIVLADLRTAPSPEIATELEAAFADLDQSFEYGPNGLLTTVGWGASWFDTYSSLPGTIGRAARMARWEDPVIDDFHLAVHLASDVPEHLEQGSELLLATDRHDLGRYLRVAEVRTGFVGQGLPAKYLDALDIPESSPLLLGFRSILKKNQASEDSITITAGPLAGGTTAHLSRIVLNVEQWHQKTRDEQAALLFAPSVSAEEADNYVDDAPSDYDRFAESVREHDIVGHAQAAARARIDNTPIINRRDFATVDDDQPGTHFISLQSELRDFNNTRAVMNGADGVDHSARVGQRYRNGINAFFTVTRRATFVIPPRSLRVFPYAVFADRAESTSELQGADSRTDVALLESLLDLADTSTVPAADGFAELVRESLDYIRSRRIFAGSEALFDITTVLNTIPDLTAANPALALILRGHVTAAFALNDSEPNSSAKAKALGDIGRGQLFALAGGWGVIAEHVDEDGTRRRQFSGRLDLDGPLGLYDWVASRVSDGLGAPRIVVLPTHRLIDQIDESTSSVDVSNVPLYPGEILVANTSTDRAPGLEAVDLAYQSGVLAGLARREGTADTTAEAEQRFRQAVDLIAGGQWSALVGDAATHDHTVDAYNTLRAAYLIS